MQALIYQGFTKDTIYYLSADTDFDLDGNGKLDDVDADATNANLKKALTGWTDEVEQLIAGGQVGTDGSGTYTLSHVPEDRSEFAYDFYPASDGDTGYPLATPPTTTGWWYDSRYEYSYAGWSLIIIYSSPEVKGQHLYIYDDFAFVGTGSSFLAYAAIAAKRGLTTDLRGRKSLYYVGGLTEGTETIALFLAICLFPDWFPWLAYGFGALCWLTTVNRILAAVEAFDET